MVGWPLNTRMFVKVMLPLLLTNPPNTTELPADTGPGGQLSVMVMLGVERIGQVIAFVIRIPLQVSWLVAVTVTPLMLEARIKLPEYGSD